MPSDLQYPITWIPEQREWHLQPGVNRITEWMLTSMVNQRDPPQYRPTPVTTFEWLSLGGTQDALEEALRERDFASAAKHAETLAASLRFLAEDVPKRKPPEPKPPTMVPFTIHKDPESYAAVIRADSYEE